MLFSLRLHTLSLLGILVLSQMLFFLLTPTATFRLSCMPGQAFTQGEVLEMGSGSSVPHEVVISARLQQSGPVRVILSEDSLDFSRGRRSSRQIAEAWNFHSLCFSFDDLQADTDYWYRLEVNGKLDTSRQAIGHFRTSGPVP